jgi:hypothetical protein
MPPLPQNKKNRKKTSPETPPKYHPDHRATPPEHHQYTTAKLGAHCQNAAKTPKNTTYFTSEFVAPIAR